MNKDYFRNAKENTLAWQIKYFKVDNIFDIYNVEGKLIKTYSNKNSINIKYLEAKASECIIGLFNHIECYLLEEV
jgi:hypothetical protein